MTSAVMVVNIKCVTVVYLSQGDISLLLGRERTMVSVWRSRFKEPSDDPGERPFPEPDSWNGLVKPVPGWLPERMPEIVEWCRDHGFEIALKPVPAVNVTGRGRSGREA